MPFNLRKAREDGHTDTAIVDYLASQNPKFNLKKAREDGHTDAAIAEYLSTPVKRQPFKAGMEAARSQLTEGLPYALEKTFGTITPEEQAAYSSKLRASGARQEELLPGGPAALGKDNLLSVLGENFAYSSPQMAASLGAGVAGGAVGTMVAPGAGTLAGLITSTAASTPFFVGSNVERSTEGGEAELTREQAARSLLAAPSQAAADAVSDRFIPGVGRLLGAPAREAVARVVGETAKDVALRVAKRTGVGAAKGAASEGIAEPLQQVGERWAAGEDLANADAMREYGQAAATAAVLGGTMGGIGAHFETARPNVEEEPAAEGGTPPLEEEPFTAERQEGPYTAEQVAAYHQDLMDLYGFSPDDAALVVAEKFGIPIVAEGANAAGPTVSGGSEPSVPSAVGERAGERPAEEVAGPAGAGLGAAVEPVSRPPSRKVPVQPALTEEPDDEEVVGERDFNDWNPTEAELDEAAADEQAVKAAKPTGAGRKLTSKQRQMMEAEELRLNRGFARNALDEAPNPDVSHWSDLQTPTSEPVADTKVEPAPETLNEAPAAPEPAAAQAPKNARKQKIKTTPGQERGTWNVQRDGSEPLVIYNKNINDKAAGPDYYYGNTQLNPEGKVNGKSMTPGQAGAKAMALRDATPAEEVAENKPVATPRRSRNEIGSYEETLEDGTKVQVRQFQSNVAKGAYKGATKAKLYDQDSDAQEATTDDLTQEQVDTQSITKRINAALGSGFLLPIEATNFRNRLRAPDKGKKQISLSRLGEETRAMYEDPYAESTTRGFGWHAKRVDAELTALLAKRPKPVVKGVNLSAAAGNTQFEEASPTTSKERTPISSIRTVEEAVKRGKLEPAIRAAATSETVKPHLSALARKLVAGGIGDANITVNDYGDRPRQVLGTSEMATGNVILNKTSNGASGYTLETLLHEAIHSFVAKRYYTIGKYLDSNKKRTGTGEQAADPFIKEFQGLWRQFHDAIFANPELLAKAKTPEAVWLREAVNSPDELLTRIFTDETLRDFLKTIDMEGKPVVAKKPTPAPAPAPSKSFWDHIVDLFAKLFGITKPNERAALEEVMDSGTPRSAFDEVLESGDRLLTAAAQDKPTNEYTEKLLEVMGARPKKVQNARAPGRPTRVRQTQPYVTTAANAPNNIPVPPSGFKSAAAKPSKGLKEQLRLLRDVATQKLNYAYQGAVVADRYIKNAMGVQPDERSFDKAFELINARKSNRKALFVNRLVEPLIAKMAELKLDLHDVDMYLWARAAPGRNAAIARKTGGGANGIQRGSGLSNADAAAIIAEYQRRGMLADLDQIAAMHDRIVKFKLDTMVDSGLITRRTATTMLLAHPYYTPMKGIASQGDITEEGEIDGGTVGVRTPYYGSRVREFMSAQGRETMPASPLTHLLQDTAGTIVRAENNRVGQVLVKLAAQNNLATDGIFQVHHQMPGNPKDYHVVKVNGAAKYIGFANTEAGAALASAYRNLSPKDMGWFGKGVTTTANVVKRLMTTWNPAFLGTAFARDVFDSMTAAKAAETDKTSPAYGKPLSRESRKYMNMRVFKAVTSYVAGKAPAPGTMEYQVHAALDSMAANGGSVGSTMLHTSEDFKEEIKSKLARAAALQAKDPVGNIKEVLQIVGDSMDKTAHAFDLFPRVATYMGAISTGLTPANAARVSLNSSLNLTRRGEWARVLDNTFFFFSPTVEGARKFTKMGLTSANGAKLMATFAGLGGMATLMNSMIAGGDDDDDGRPNYMDVPKVTQQTRLVFFFGPGSNDYFSIPLGFMMAYPTYVGTKATQAMLGATSGESAGVMMTEAAVDLAAGLASSMSPLRPAGDQVQESVASLAPSLAKPFADLAINKNYFGSNIYNKQFDSRIARSTMGRESTGDVWKWVAETLNSATGGAGGTSGFIDLQPEQYRYLFEAYTGGPYRTIKDTAKVFDENNEDTGLARVPIIRGFVGKGAEYVPMNQYFKNTKQLASLEYSERTADDETWEGQQRKYPVDTDPRVMDAYVGAERELDNLRRFRLKELDSTSDGNERKQIIKDYRELNKEIYADFNRTYNEVRKEIQNSEG